MSVNTPPGGGYPPPPPRPPRPPRPPGVKVPGTMSVGAIVGLVLLVIGISILVAGGLCVAVLAGMGA